MQIMLTLRYLGTHYCGYQVQPNGVSVQATVQDALEAIYQTRPGVVGCSRTDSGVHALGFKLTFFAPQTPRIDIDHLPSALNRFLPRDISVIAACMVPDSFHVRYDVAWKTYEYLICNAPWRDPFWEGRAYHCLRKLDEVRMNEGAGLFLGEHDFAAFMASGSQVQNTVRVMYDATVRRQGEMVIFSVRGNGFLYHMVRNMAGTLMELSFGKCTEEQIVTALQSGGLQSKKFSMFTAPAHGLYLKEVQHVREEQTSTCL